MLTFESILDAAKVLDGVVSRTALVSADALDTRAKQVFIKAENLQKTGSFKLRGAYYKISRLTKEELGSGVIAASAGNHAQGVAFAAKKAGASCVICMPEGAPLSKIEQTKSYGATVELCRGVFDDCVARAKQLQAEKGYTLIHAFDDEDVIAGQGTVGLEIMQQLPDADIVFVPVGGGGLIGGIALAVKNINPSAMIVGVEASGAASMFLSRKRQSVVELDSVSTIADGIAVKRPGELTFELCSRYADKIVTVSDAEIASAMLLLMERYKMIAEGAGAVAVAAAMYAKLNLSGKKAVCVVSGGNVDVNVLSTLINKGLKNTGRITQFSTELIDKPHQLGTLLQIVSDEGANILNIFHDRSKTDVDIGRCFVDITVETRNHNHARELLDALNARGYLGKSLKRIFFRAKIYYFMLPCVRKNLITIANFKAKYSDCPKSRRGRKNKLSKEIRRRFAEKMRKLTGEKVSCNHKHGFYISDSDSDSDLDFRFRETVEERLGSAGLGVGAL